MTFRLHYNDFFPETIVSLKINLTFLFTAGRCHVCWTCVATWPTNGGYDDRPEKRPSNWICQIGLTAAYAPTETWWRGRGNQLHVLWHSSNEKQARKCCLRTNVYCLWLLSFIVATIQWLQFKNKVPNLAYKYHSSQA